eukprot:GHVO01037159.1.p2 GENE.GHVO01037159.1~~GHVO01037159.1.p2  ORF type:complete len:103 (-),score=8.56 GHVO01037159.1:55-363(-)
MMTVVAKANLVTPPRRLADPITATRPGSIQSHSVLKGKPEDPVACCHMDTIPTPKARPYKAPPMLFSGIQVSVNILVSVDILTPQVGKFLQRLLFQECTWQR